MSTVVVLDPDERSRRVTAAALRHGGYRVAIAHDGKQVRSLIGRRAVAAVVVDPAVGDAPGSVDDLRSRTDAPIIVISDRTEEREKVAVLDAGADDYLCKPVGVEELLARLRGAIRRNRRRETEYERVETAHFTIQLDDRRLVRLDGDEVRLTPTEWRLLDVLVRRPGHLVPQSELLARVWGPEAVTRSGYLRVHIANIRRKLEPEPARPRYFITAPGLGHRFDPRGGGAAGDVYRTVGASAASTASSHATKRTPIPGSVTK